MKTKIKIFSLIVFLFVCVSFPNIIFAQSEQGYQGYQRYVPGSGTTGTTPPTSDGGFMPGAIFSQAELERMMTTNLDFNNGYAVLSMKLANDEIALLKSGGDYESASKILEEKFVSDINQLYSKYKNSSGQTNNPAQNQEVVPTSQADNGQPSQNNSKTNIFSSIGETISSVGWAISETEII